MLACDSVFPHWQHHWTWHLFEKIPCCYMFIRSNCKDLELLIKEYTWNHQAFWIKTFEFIISSLWIAFDSLVFRQSEADEYFVKLIGSFQRPSYKKLLHSQIFTWRSLVRSSKQCYGSNFQFLYSWSTSTLPIQTASRKVPNFDLVGWWLGGVFRYIWWFCLLLQTWRSIS